MVLEYVIVILLGLSFGSFANVCINRLPKGNSILFSSRCEYCQSNIRSYDNIPVLSFLFLKGLSRCCNKKISIQYPLIELITAILLFVIFLNFGISTSSVLIFVFLFSLLLIFMTDFKEYIIPNAITYPFAALALIITFFEINPFGISLLNSILGGVIPGILFFLISKGFLVLRKKEGLGMGDVKMIAMVGFWVGMQSTLIVIVISSLAGILWGVILIVFKYLKASQYLPYGCFISIASVLVTYLDLWLKFNIFHYLVF